MNVNSSAFERTNRFPSFPVLKDDQKTSSDSIAAAKKKDLLSLISSKSLLSSETLGWFSVICAFSITGSGLEVNTMSIPFYLIFGIFAFVSFTTQYLGIYSFSFQPFQLLNVIIASLSMVFITLGAFVLGTLDTTCLLLLAFKLFFIRNDPTPFNARSANLKNYIAFPICLFVINHILILLGYFQCSYSVFYASVFYILLGVFIRVFYLVNKEKFEKKELAFLFSSIVVACLIQFNVLPLGTINLSVTRFTILCFMQIFCINWDGIARIQFYLGKFDISLIMALISTIINKTASQNSIKIISCLYQVGFCFFKIGSSITANLKLPDNSRIYRLYNDFIVNGVLADKESRSIFYFFLLNVSYMFVQVIYGLWTNSLGLISDAIHMAFDCIAILVGLVATTLAKMPLNYAYPFGFAKIEALSGFTNGIFLVLISFSIVGEALYRLFHPPQMNTDQLLLVSFLGLVVNLVGILAFNHGHNHDHGSHHHHSHSNHSMCLPNTTNDINIFEEFEEEKDNVEAQKMGYTNDDHVSQHEHTHENSQEHHHQHSQEHHHEHNHNHDHIHKYNEKCDHESISLQNLDNDHHCHHHHENHNMHGIFLHIIADTMGSVGVIVSTILIQWFSWTGFDPLASLIIAALIFVSVLPLIKDSAKNLLSVTDPESEYLLKQCLSNISLSNSVISLSNPKFWTNERGEVYGILHIQVSIDGDLNVVRNEVFRKLSIAVPNLKHICIQSERPNNCWCGK
ncbi:putative zinc transporter cis4 [Schizosaccharomyces pombe]